MINKLKSQEFIKARSVMADLDIHLAVTALLEGSSPGEIFVDDANDPKSVFAWTMKRFFLAGWSGNQEFNLGVREYFNQQVYTGDGENGIEGFTIYYSPNGWGKVVNEVILMGRHPIPGKRHYYQFVDFKQDWHKILPKDYSIFPVDRFLLDNKSLKNHAELVEEMKSERPTVQSFLENSFGFALVRGEELAAWCISEYNSGDKCEVGIETYPDHRRRNLATVAASALIEEAQSRGYQHIGWHCYADNDASIATALKVGFEKESEYDAMWAMIDETINLAMNGNACFQRQDYSGAIRWQELAIKTGGAPAWIYWNLACAYAHLEDISSTFKYLNQAVDQGFTDVEHVKRSVHFTQWHDCQEWTDLIERLDA